MQLKARPCVAHPDLVLPWLQLIGKCCVYIACCCYSPCVHKQVPGCTVPIVTLLACSCKLLHVHCGVPGVVNVARLLYLKCMHVLVETSIYVSCLLFPLRHQHVCAFIKMMTRGLRLMSGTRTLYQQNMWVCDWQLTMCSHMSMAVWTHQRHSLILKSLECTVYS